MEIKVASPEKNKAKGNNAQNIAAVQHPKRNCQPAPNASPEYSEHSKKRSCKANRDKSCDSTIKLRAPFGTFSSGSEIFRNKIANNETDLDGHYKVEELVPPYCTSSLCTTFTPPNPSWLGEIFPDIPDLIVVLPAPEDQDMSNVPFVGEACMKRIFERRKRGWFWVIAKPHTGGCLHAKLLLFRSNEGLRVIVSGCNLCARQWNADRDVFWAQDFPVLPSNGSEKCNCFKNDLYSFLSDVSQCADFSHQLIINNRIDSLLRGIDFSVASAKLVVSFPRRQNSGKVAGGYESLANAVRDSLDCLEDSDDDSIDSFEDIANFGILYANAGSVGNLEASFVFQMYRAMNGKDDIVPTGTTWAQVEDRFRWLWPSAVLARDMDPMSLGCLRGIPWHHYRSIPDEVKRKVFHDAPPNPPNKTKIRGLSEDLMRQLGLDDIQYYPVTHGKFMYNSRGILYVGSHNLSKTAWGLRNMQPKNVEVGVVLASSSLSTKLKWSNRFPCQLPLDTRPPSNYVPFFRIPSEAYAANRIDQNSPGATAQLKRFFMIEELSDFSDGNDEDDL